MWKKEYKIIEILKVLNKYDIGLFKNRVINGLYVNIKYFPFYENKNINEITLKDFLERKFNYFNIIEKNKEELLLIKDQLNDELKNEEIIQNNINFYVNKLNFIEETYDIEAKKVFPFYPFSLKKPDYNYYSKSLYWITKKEIPVIQKFPEKKTFDIWLSKKELIKLLKYAKWLIWFNYNIDKKLLNKSHNSWTLNIPEQKQYNIKDIITIFFHEATHYIRYYNNLKNVWNIIFYDKNELEEGITLYNEYKYGNMIIDLWEYYPVYDKIYNILLSDKTKKEKLEQIKKILEYKFWWEISNEKVELFYKRFYRFAPLWWKDFLLKETIYYSGLKKVKKMLKEWWYTMKELLSIKWWINSINFYKNNFNIKNYINANEYYEKMVKKIKEMI